MKKIITELCVYILKKLNASVFLNCDIAEKNGEVYIGMNDGGLIANMYVEGSKELIFRGISTRIGFIRVCGRFKPVDEEVV